MVSIERVAKIEKGSARQAQRMRKLVKEHKATTDALAECLLTLQQEALSSRKFNRFLVFAILACTFAGQLILKYN